MATIYAICARPQCRAAVEFSSPDPGPYKCPKCGSRMLRGCLDCRHAIIAIPTPEVPWCQVCGLDLFSIRYAPEKLWRKKIARPRGNVSPTRHVLNKILAGPQKKRRRRGPMTVDGTVEKQRGDGGKAVEAPDGAEDLHRPRKNFHRPADHAEAPSPD